MSYTDTHAARLRDMKSLAQKIQSKAGLYDKAWTHNSKPRGNLLGTSITDAQHSAIANGSFKDIYPGDYWALGSYKLLVADCDPYSGYNIYWGKSLNHHVVCMVLNTKPSIPMTDDNSITGGLTGTRVYTEMMPEILSEVEDLVGSDNILTMPTTLIADTVDASTGHVTHWLQSRTERIFLPTAVQLYGYSTGRSLYRDFHRQFALFRHVSVLPAMWIPKDTIVNYMGMWLAEISVYDVINESGWSYGYGGRGGTQQIQGWYVSGSVSKQRVFPYILLK